VAALREERDSLRTDQAGRAGYQYDTHNRLGLERSAVNPVRSPALLQIVPIGATAFLRKAARPELVRARPKVTVGVSGRRRGGATSMPAPTPYVSGLPHNSRVAHEQHRPTRGNTPCTTQSFGRETCPGRLLPGASGPATTR
jgi:hypothetical protein